MNRQLHLDTENHASHAGLNRRFSILQTPLEMHAPGVQPPTNDDPTLRQRSAATSEPDYAQPSSTDAANKEIGSSEKAQQPTFPQDNAPIAPPYIMPGSPPPPPPEQHPANFAPYADEMTQQRPRPALNVQPLAHHPDADNAIVPQDSYGPVPNSPGPLPIKGHPTHADQGSNTRPLAVEPDTNPLQSPLFPPPTATSASQAPVPEDITTYHQPGQVRHPNQTIKGGTWSHSLCDCSNISACCLGIFCPCILYGKTQYRLGLKSRKEDPTNMLGFDSCNGSCTAMALLCGCQCRTIPLTSSFFWQGRGHLANKFRAPGNYPTHPDSKNIRYPW